jgi:thymidylate synthase (FAD)
MKLIKQSVQRIDQEEGINGVYKMIERAGRVCYKSEDKITDTSCVSFVDRLINTKHYSVLEHGTVYLYFKGEQRSYTTDEDIIYEAYKSNPYSMCLSIIENAGSDTPIIHYYITTNFRVIVENDWKKDLQYICEPTSFHPKRTTFHITTDIGIGRELTRHRVFSFSQESSRYCNYNKDKFGKELTFIIPNWCKEDSINTKQSNDERAAWLAHSLRDAEISYMSMLDKGASPQEARVVLPLCTKTELIMTGFDNDWCQFLNVRYYGATGKPHPDMVDLAKMIDNAF